MPAFHGAEVVSVHQDGTLGGGLLPQEHLDEGALSRPGGTYNENELPFFHMEGYMMEGMGAALVGL